MRRPDGIGPGYPERCTAGTVEDARWRMERGSSDRYRSLVSDSQAGPPFGTTTGNDLPSTFGAHPFTKTVLPFALEIGRLLICK